MNLKERIIGDFLKDDRRNFTIYQTNFNELARMYDKLVNSIKSGEKFERFLTFENAITQDGKIRFDLTVDFYDKESKKTIPKQKVVFKYAVYNYLNTEYRQAMAAIKEKENSIPLPVENFKQTQEQKDVEWVNANL